MFCFGIVTTLQGLVQNYSGLIATRLFLGLTEAGVFPGCKSRNHPYISLLIVTLHRFLLNRDVVQTL